MSLSNFLEDALLDHIRGGTAYTQPTSLHIKLHIGDPGETGTANAATETTRKTATFGAASSGSMALSNSPLEWALVAATETYTHFSVWDNSTAGNCLGSGALSAPAAMTAGDTFRVTSLNWSLE